MAAVNKSALDPTAWLISTKWGTTQTAMVSGPTSIAKIDQTVQIFSHSHALRSRIGARNNPQHNPQDIASNKPGTTVPPCPSNLVAQFHGPLPYEHALPRQC